VIPRVPHYLITATINNISKLSNNKVNLTVRTQYLKKLGGNHNRYTIYDQSAKRVGRVANTRSEVYDALRVIEDVLYILEREQRKLEIVALE
jgi:hypothetical protein